MVCCAPQLLCLAVLRSHWEGRPACSHTPPSWGPQVRLPGVGKSPFPLQSSGLPCTLLPARHTWVRPQQEHQHQQPRGPAHLGPGVRGLHVHPQRRQQRLSPSCGGRRRAGRRRPRPTPRHALPAPLFPPNLGARPGPPTARGGPPSALPRAVLPPSLAPGCRSLGPEGGLPDQSSQCWDLSTQPRPSPPPTRGPGHVTQLHPAQPVALTGLSQHNQRRPVA